MALQPKDVGLKIAQPGFDIDTAADYQLLFNSAWPSLPIAFDKTVGVGSNFAVTTVTHGLGFYPLTFAYIKSADNYIGRSGMSRVGPTLYIGQNNIYLQGDHNNTYTVNVKAYNVDLGIAADYTQPSASAIAQPYNSDYGFKLAKAGKDCDSDDLRDYIIHTRAQSPAILSVITETSAKPDGSQLSLTYTNPAGITNWVYGFILDRSTTFEPRLYRPAPFAAQTSNGISISGATYKLYITPGDQTSVGATIVVLRDPLFGSNEVSAVY